MSSEEKTNICRVCLRTDIVNTKKCISLFEKCKDSIISDSINAIANISITKGDGLPTKICPDCLLELETAITFKQKCETSDTILKSSGLGQFVGLWVEAEVDINCIKKEEPDEVAIDCEPDIHFEEVNHSELENDNIKTEDLLKPVFKSKAIDLKLICDDCGESFKSKCKIRVHWKKVHLPQALICPTCKRAFKAYKPFNRHIKSKKKSCISAANMRVEGIGKSRVFHCKSCQYSSRRMRDITTHLLIHSGEKPWVCSICSKAFSQQSSLQGHTETAHRIYKVEITCQYCGKYVQGRNKVYSHLKRHTQNQVQCDMCKKMLSSKEALKAHMVRHYGVKSFTCEKCASTFFTIAELCNHKRMTHNKDNIWYKCDICGYKVHRNESLKKHKAKHTDTNVVCVTCGMFLENLQKWEDHQKRHDDRNKYPCPHCEVKFFNKKSLGKHIRAKHRCTMLANKPTPIKKESTFVNIYNNLIEVSLVDVVDT